MIFYQSEWIAAFVLIFVFITMGKMEARDGTSRDWGLLWALLSIACSALVIQFVSADWKIVLVANVILYFAIAAGRLLLDRDSEMD